MVIKDRNGEILKTESASRFQKFLYKNFLGRLLLKLLIQPFVSKTGGLFMSSRLSKILIKRVMKKQRFDMSLYEKTHFNSFNDFFTRKLKAENIKIDTKENHFISPCDSKLTVFEIDKGGVFEIKNSFYSVGGLLKNHELAKKYENGYILIFRLEVTDYHRYLYIDDGNKGENTYIKGVLHTVNPVALGKYPVYVQNSRSFSVLETKNFGAVTQIEVGALMVGKIKNHHASYTFKRGEEKGMFLFGGSTIILLAEKDHIKIDSEILENSLNMCETVVKAGEKIGERI